MTAILLFGFLLLGLSLYDLIITVIAPKGAGPLTDRICRLVSRLGKTISISTGWLCLLIVVTAWVLLLWMGWSVIFLSDPNSLVNSQTGVPTDVAEKAYFVGYCLSTLGLGDYTPTSDIWRLTTNFVSFSGLGTITLAITYIIPVLSAATEKRQLADLLHDLFSTPLAEVDRDRLLDRLDNTIWPHLNLHTERHLAYPILHNFLARTKDKSLAMALLKMHNSLRTLPRASTQHIFSALDRFLTIIEQDFVAIAEPTGETPEDIREAKLQAFVDDWR